MQEQNRIWIDVAKTVAIVGVVLQHVRGTLYTNDNIFYSMWYAVALFIMIGGFNAMKSWQRRGYVVVKSRIARILIDYVVATAAYLLFHEHFLDMEHFISKLIHFDAAGPLYYVAVYIWLVISTPILIGAVEWCSGKHTALRYMTVFTVIILICYFTTNYTNVLDIILGGGNLFAGPWLFIWFIGICIAKWDFNVGKNVRVCLVSALSIFIVLWQWFFILIGYNMLVQPVFNGNQVLMTWANLVEAILIFYWIKLLFETVSMSDNRIYNVFSGVICFLGKHSLYVFLYHILFITIAYKCGGFSGRIRSIISLVAVLICPVILEYLVEYIKKIIQNILGGISVK